MEIGWQCCQFYTPLKLIHALKSGSPSIFIIDELLPVKRGSEIITELRSNGYNQPMLMLSALGEPRQRVNGLESGADDYLAKPFLFRELQLRLERLISSAKEAAFNNDDPKDGSLRSSPRYRIGSWQLGRSIVDSRKLCIMGDAGIAVLSRGDMALLDYFCRHPGEVISRDSLANASGSLVDATQSRSIDVRISRLRRAIRISSNEIDAIETVRGHGYRLILKVAPISCTS
jgi:DNA-binding response OmpR family regulator